MTASWQERLQCLADIAAQDNLAKSTVMSIRTAISATTPQVNGIPFGQLPEVLIFSKGMIRHNLQHQEKRVSDESFPI